LQDLSFVEVEARSATSPSRTHQARQPHFRRGSSCQVVAAAR